MLRLQFTLLLNGPVIKYYEDIGIANLFALVITFARFVSAAAAIKMKKTGTL